MQYKDLTEEQIKFFTNLGILYLKNTDPELWPEGASNILKDVNIDLINYLENVRTRKFKEALLQN
jgi:hypothetical protein